MGFSGSIGHLSGIESPWGNSGGVVKTVKDVEAMASTGVGWIEAGSYTLESRFGNAWNSETNTPDKVVYNYNADTGETANSLGMPNQGLDKLVQEIPDMVRVVEAKGKQLVVNVAPVSAEPVAESLELVRRSYEAGAHAVLLNAGCPNVVTTDGGRHEILSQNAEVLRTVLNGLRTYLNRENKQIFVRTSPIEDPDTLAKVMGVIRTSKLVGAVFTPNTWPGFVPRDASGSAILEVPGGAGGKSGPAVAEDAIKQTRLAIKLLGKNIDVVSSAGIMDALELKRRLQIGAVAGAGTTFYYESANGWQPDTDKLLAELSGSL